MNLATKVGYIEGISSGKNEGILSGKQAVDPFEGAPLGNLVFTRTYSRNKEDGGKESWQECVERCVNGNIGLVDERYIEPGEADRLKDLMYRRVLLPGGRHLWASGTNSMALQNCFRAGWNHGFQSHVAFVFDQLMRGGGVGANYSSSYFEKMPRFLSRVQPRFRCDETHADYETLVALGLFETASDDPHITVRLQVADSREGWVHALEQLIWHSINSVPLTLVYDVSNVRCLGSPIRGFGGTAGGPAPLMLMLLQVAKLLEGQRGKRPTPLFAMEVDHQIATCVVAGNLRRSARMAIVHWRDPEIFEFIHCKEDHSKHWSTNISVEIDQDFFDALERMDRHADDVLDHIIQGMLRNGEPGIYNSSLASEGETGDVRATNPCGELPLEAEESCILGHVNLAKGTTAERHEAFRLMTRFLVRTTCAPIQDPKQREVVQRNRRIGVGFFGLQEYMARDGLSYNDDLTTLAPLTQSLQEWKLLVRTTADTYAAEMGIPAPIKVTTVAPTGTIAKLAGTTEGVQPIFARHFIRRIRYATNDPGCPTQYPLEQDLYSSGTVVVSVPCEDPVVARVNGKEHLLVDAAELSPDKALQLQALIQEHYTDNSISHTINVLEGSTSPADLKATLLKYLPRLKGTTIMVDSTRPQSPYERISKQKYLELIQREEIQYSTTDDSLIEGCVGGACPVK